MGTGKYSFIIDGMTWSYSRISSYYDCKYKWFQKYILCESEDDMFYASYGKLMHSILEGFYKGLIPRDMLVGEFISRYQAEVKGARPSADIAESYFQNGVKYLKTFTPFEYKVLQVEEMLSGDISGVNFIGIIDLLCEDEDGSLIVIDNKSRSLKQRSNRKKPTKNDKEIDDMLRQMYLYAFLVKEKYGRFPSKFIFNCFKSGTIVVEPFVKEKYDETIKWAVNTINVIADENDFAPFADYFACNWLCGYNKDCPYK